MADPIGASASIIGLVIIAINAIVQLHDGIQGIKNHPEEVAALLADLKDLEQVLIFLRNVVGSKVEDLVKLNDPVSRCTEMCKKFQIRINSCAGENPGKRAAVIGWAKLQLAKSEILKFKEEVGRTKATITLTLASVSLEKFTLTEAVLNDYQEIIMKTMSETRQSLESINRQLEHLSKEGSGIAGQDVAKVNQLCLERRRCEKNIEALSNALEHLKTVEVERLTVDLGGGHSANSSQTIAPKREQLSAGEVRNFMEKIPPTISELNSQLAAIGGKVHPLWREHMELRQRLLAEKQDDEDCLRLLQQVNEKVKDKQQTVFRDIRAAKKADQTIMSQVGGDSAHFQNISAGVSAKQFLGQTTEASFQAWCQKNASNERPLEQRRAARSQQWIVWMACGVVLNFGLLAWSLRHGTLQRAVSELSPGD